MSNDLSVDIVASDKTAAGVNSARKTLKGVRDDLKALSSGKGSFADFSRNLKSNLSGDKAQAILGQLGKAKGGGDLLDMARNFGQAAEAAEALAGTMGVLGVATGGVVAGLGAAGAAAYAFSKPWMKGAANIGQLSMALGIATRDLQLFESAAARMGVTKDQADQALSGLGDAAHAALYSPAGAQQRAMFGALGIDVHKYADKNGQLDLPSLMQAVATGIQSQGNAQSQAHVASALGVSSALPALRQGGGWLRSNTRSAAAFGYMSDSDVAKGMLAAQDDTILGQYRDSLVRRARGAIAKNLVAPALDAAAGGISSYAGAPQSQQPALETLAGSKGTGQIRLAPGLGPIKTPDRIQLLQPGQGLADLSARLPTISLEQVVTAKLAPAAEKLLTAAEGLQASGGLAYAFNRFLSLGRTPREAAGMVANIARESKGQIDAIGDSGLAYGLGQWHPDRQRDFTRFSGRGIRGSTLDEQLDFYNHELYGGTRSSAGRRLSRASSDYDAGAIVSRFDEAPRDAALEADFRGKLAAEIGTAVRQGLNGATITFRHEWVGTAAGGGIRTARRGGPEQSFSRIHHDNTGTG